MFDRLLRSDGRKESADRGPGGKVGQERGASQVGCSRIAPALMETATRFRDIN